MVKKSDISKVPKPEPKVEEVKIPESAPKPKLPKAPEVKVEPKFELVLPAPDLSPVVDAVKEMANKQEPKVIQIEKDRKPKGFRVTITKRDYRGLIEEFECKEITDG